MDYGYYSEAAVQSIESKVNGPLHIVQVIAATKRQRHGRSSAELEQRSDPPAPPEGASIKEKMAHRLESKAGKARYAQRKQTVEPVFGIIKGAMGFRMFGLRSLSKLRLEWTVMSLS